MEFPKTVDTRAGGGGGGALASKQSAPSAVARRAPASSCQRWLAAPEQGCSWGAAFAAIAVTQRPDAGGAPPFDHAIGPKAPEKLKPTSNGCSGAPLPSHFSNESGPLAPVAGAQRQLLSLLGEGAMTPIEPPFTVHF